MPEKIFDPTIHQDLDHLAGFKFRHTALTEGIEAFKNGSEVHKNATCGTLAKLSGLAESTFKKLKQGQINDPRLSTCWLVCVAFNIDPRKLMGLPVKDAPNHVHEAHNATTQALIDEKDKRIKDLENGLAKREYIIKRQNRMLALALVCIIALLIADIITTDAGWLRLAAQK